MIKKLALLLLYLCSLSVFADPINKIVFLGDSLTDNGNLYRIIRIPKSPPYYAGRFSNGPTWGEHVGDYFKARSNINYKIYAVGGATAIYHAPSVDFVAPSNLDLELTQYLTEDLFNTHKSQVLYSIWIGGNDYLFDRKDDSDALTTDVVNKISRSITRLIDNGAKNFLILDLPDLSRIPMAEAEGISERLGELTQKHNKKLADEVHKLTLEHPDVKFTFINIYDIMLDMVNNLDKYNKKYDVNITNLKQPCWVGSLMFNKKITAPALQEAEAVGNAYMSGETPCSNPDGYLFWDKMHPTAVVHRILGNLIQERLVQENY